MAVLIPGTPRPQGSMRTYVAGGRARARHSDTTIDHRNRVTYELERANTGRPTIKGPVEVDLSFCFARPASHFGTGKNAGIIKPSAPWKHIQPPDLDKLVRLVLDAMENAGVVANDSQIASVHASKMWVVDNPCTIITWRETGK